MLKYRFALCNVFWSEDEENTRFFPTVEQQAIYFDNKVNGLWTDLANFNMGNNVETEITYRDESGRTPEELVSCNYAVLEKLEDENVLFRRYYFAYPQQDSYNQMRVKLSLDDIQTNYFQYKDTIPQVMIKRACLNRFKPNNEIGYEGQYKFDKDASSPFFNGEQIGTYNKYVATKQPIYFNTYFKDETLNNWLNDNIRGWYYVFLNKPSSSYSGDGEDQMIYTLPLSYRSVIPTSIQFSPPNFDVLCYPIYTGEKIIKFKNRNKTKDVFINHYGLQAFFRDNNSFSYVSAVKLSAFPPFGKDTNLLSQDITQPEYEIDSEGNLIFNYKRLNNIDSFITEDTATSSHDTGVLFLREQSPFVDSSLINMPYKDTFLPSEIIDKPFDYRLCPKVWSDPLFSIKLVNGFGDGFEYDYSKFYSFPKIIARFNEPLTPDLSKSFIRLIVNSDIYNTYNVETNLTGTIENNDNSMILLNDQYNQMLANNKNYFMQSYLGNLLGFGSGITQSGINLAKGNFFGAVVSGADSVTNLLTNVINRNFSVDNLRNSPANVNQGKGNPIFQLQKEGFQVFACFSYATTNDILASAEYFHKFGYSYNRLGKLSDYDNIRSKFNYIEADVETISAPISNIEKERLKNRLRAVRFWNSDDIDYSLENYERSLVP